MWPIHDQQCIQFSVSHGPPRLPGVISEEGEGRRRKREEKWRRKEKTKGKGRGGGENRKRRRQERKKEGGGGGEEVKNGEVSDDIQLLIINKGIPPSF